MRSSRNKNRLDYKIFHKSGEKVSKNREIFNMSDTIDEELKIVCKINRFLEENDLSLFSDVEEIDNSLEKIRILQQEYEEVHIKLRRELGDDEYQKTYTEYEKSQDVMMTWLKDAKFEKKRKKDKSSEQILEKLRAEEKFLFKKIFRELQNIESEHTSLVDDYERQLCVAEKSISEYTEVFRKIAEQGPIFVQEFGDKYEDQCQMLN